MLVFGGSFFWGGGDSEFLATSNTAIDRGVKHIKGIASIWKDNKGNIMVRGPACCIALTTFFHTFTYQNVGMAREKAQKLREEQQVREVSADEYKFYCTCSISLV